MDTENVNRTLPWNDRMRQAGLCYRCGKAKAVPGRTCCAPCLKFRRDRARERRKEMEAAGVCYWCGVRPSEPGKRRCTECLNLSNQRTVDGLCRLCGKQSVVPGKRQCQSCIDRKKRLYKENLEYYRTNAKRHSRKNRRAVLDHYGAKCACCGETTEEFLAIDHINNDGAEHRKSVGSGTTFYRWLIKNNFPDGFQVLCHNCNQAKGLYGQCPHETARHTQTA